ncbi:ribonuclease domain-containing protein [Fluviispira vulneris]|uniref:ribonuclease domain-containing protein n=1 Tax=Fluviispira vulneris TaxID=2763012 RepID=UPI001647490D|nr:ribonuclease domain-containing protein [Fluviispira vulneris]
MKVHIKKISFFIALLSSPSIAFAGSYLFCSNDKSEWHWAYKPSSQQNHQEKEYYWLHGSLNIVNAPVMLHSALKLDFAEDNMHQTDENIFYGIKIKGLNRKKRASLSQHNNNYDFFPSDAASQRGISKCRELVNHCTNSFGPSFHYVGAAGYSIAITDWGYVIADNIICPNWHYPSGLITDTMSVGSLIGQIALDTLTSGPIEKPGVLVGESSAGVGEIAMGAVHSIEQTSIGEGLTPEAHNSAQGPQMPSYASMAKAVSMSDLNSGGSEFHRTGSLRNSTIRKMGIPARAYNASEKIDFKTAKRFMNYERRINETGEFYEIDIPLDPRDKDQSRDAKRVVVNKLNGNRWYTNDHYLTFRNMGPISPELLAQLIK